MTGPADQLQRALWRDDRQTAGEWMAWWEVREQHWPPERRREEALKRWKLETAQDLGFPTWDAYLAHLEEERVRAATPGNFDQPPAEVTTRDPRPADAPADPPAIARLENAAHASWEVRVGYCRGYRKVGRGNVGTGSDARWELHHFVILEARPAGLESRAWVQVGYAAPAVQPLKWKHDGSTVPGKWKATAAEAKAMLETDSAVVVATVSATRQPVTPTTDMFAA